MAPRGRGCWFYSCRLSHNKGQAVEAFDAHPLSYVSSLGAAGLPELAEHADLPGRVARGDDLGYLTDHGFGSGLRSPAAGQPEAPDELDRLDPDAAEHRDQVPGPGREERENDR